MKKKDDRLIYTATHLANYFIKNLYYVDNVRLNKFVYLTFGVAYVYYRKRILFKEPIQAWRLGPVIPSIYHEFKKYGYGKITDSSFIDNPITKKKEYPYVKSNDEEAIAALEVVKENYGQMSVNELIDNTHEKGGAWEQSYIEGENNIEIPLKLIEESFMEIVS